MKKSTREFRERIRSVIPPSLDGTREARTRSGASDDLFFNPIFREGTEKDLRISASPFHMKEFASLEKVRTNI